MSILDLWTYCGTPEYFRHKIIIIWKEFSFARTIIEKFDALALKPGQELGQELQQEFDRHLTVTRKLQKSAISTPLSFSAY